jgi:hypothetical protein
MSQKYANWKLEEKVMGTMLEHRFQFYSSQFVRGDIVAPPSIVYLKHSPKK